jgi:hypothetical protein
MQQLTLRRTKLILNKGMPDLSDLEKIGVINCCDAILLRFILSILHSAKGV